MARTCLLCGNAEKPFFEFPHSAKLRRKWFKILRQRYQIANVSDRDVICVKHFRQSNLHIHGHAIKLKAGAVPMINNDDRAVKEIPPPEEVKIEITDEEMKCEEELPGSSTPPPSFHNIIISSPKTIEPNEDEDFYYAEKDERISLILSRKFSFLQEQLPLKIAASDYQAMKEIIYSDDVFRDATLLTKVHCTVCDTHLGASPIAQFDRFVHPLLNTLMCESCFVFYNTGEFTKDVDGSEIYCRWCAQGGTVMCCSDCPFVFCKVCVERNFGEEVCEQIANADTWLCFQCNPSQLSKLHIMCSAVHEYTLKIIKKAMLTGDKDLLEKDISICCKEDSTITKKRKHIVLADGVDLENIRSALRKRMKFSTDCVTPGATIADKKKNDPPTLKRPPTPVKLRAIPTAQLQDPKSPATSTARNFSSFSDASKVNAAAVQRKTLPKTISLPTSPQSPPFVPSSSPPPLVPAFSIPLRSQYTAITQDPPPLRPVMPVITKIEGNVGNASNTTSEGSTKKMNTPCRPLGSVEEHQWLTNALDKSCDVMNTFMRRSRDIREKMKTPKNYAQFAELQNRMQHALSQCSTMMLHTRKQLHREFLQFLAAENVTFSTNSRITKQNASPRVLPAANKTAVASVDGAAGGKNSTILLRNNGTNVLTPLPTGLKVINQTRPLLLKPPGSQPPILIRPTQSAASLKPVAVRTMPSAISTNAAIKTTASLKPVLLNQIQPAKTVRLVNSNVKSNSIVISQVGSKSIGNIVPSSMVTAGKKNMYVKHVIDVKKAKADDRDPLAMSDDESSSILQSMLKSDAVLSEVSSIKTEIDIDESITIKIEEDEA